MKYVISHYDTDAHIWYFFEELHPDGRMYSHSNITKAAKFTSITEAQKKADEIYKIHPHSYVITPCST